MSVEKVDRYGIDLYNPSGWSRRTVADGAWLNENTVYPLSANDVFLASAIHDVSGYADDISAAADEMFDYTLNYVVSNDDYLSGEIVTSATNLNQHILEIGEQLQGEIDTLKGASDVIDVFNTFSEFTAWSADPTYIVTDNDIIKVLNDESYSADQTYYRYSSATSAWGYFGSLDPYYSKTDINTFSASLSSTVDNKFIDISGTVDSRLSNKKDKQTSAEFTGSTTQTITNIKQTSNGEISATYSNIVFPAVPVKGVQVNGTDLMPDSSGKVNVEVPVKGVQRNGTDLTPDLSGKVNVEVPLYVEINRNTTTFNDVKAIINEGNIPYLVTSDSGYKTIYKLSLDGKSGSGSKYFSFVYTSNTSIHKYTLYDDDSWRYGFTTVQSALSSGEFIDIDSNGYISVKKAINTDYGCKVNYTSGREVAFPANPQNPRDAYRSFLGVPLPSAGYYRIDFNVIIRVDNIPQELPSGFNGREMRIYVCSGDKTACIAMGGYGVRFVFPDPAPTGTLLSVTGSFIIGAASPSNVTLNISNEAGTGSVKESLFIDYSHAYWEKIASFGS